MADRKEGESIDTVDSKDGRSIRNKAPATEETDRAHDHGDKDIDRIFGQRRKGG